MFMSMTSAARITARLAMSLDGYIASTDGGFDWIRPDVDDHLDTSRQHDFDDYLQDVDIVGSGRPLFCGDYPAQELTLAEYSVTRGKVRLRYVRRAAGS